MAKHKPEGITGVTISHDVADAITVATLKRMRKDAKEMIKRFKSSGWIHPQDEADCLARIAAVNLLLSHMT